MLGASLFMQGRFADAIGPLRESAHLNATAPQSHSLLAACYGQLGDIEAGRASLEEMRRRSPLDIRELGASLIRAPSQRQLFMDGIARIDDAGR
jgi:hypothetical protein